MKSLFRAGLIVFAWALLGVGCGSADKQAPDAAGPSCVEPGHACSDDSACCNGNECLFGICQARVCLQAMAICNPDAGTSQCCQGLNCVMICDETTQICSTTCE